MSRSKRLVVFFAIALPLLETSVTAQTTPEVRRLRGLYSVVEVSFYISLMRTSNPSITDAELHTYFVNLYNEILANPAVSGVALAIDWTTLNPNPQSGSTPYDFSWLDDAFSAAAAFNAANPSQAPRTVRLHVSAGFNSPQWLLNSIPSCDGLFMTPVQTPSTNCGTATFIGFGEGGFSNLLPMPWNATYNSALNTFLTALAAQYLSNPLFVAIDVMGPTASSTEMIMPTNGNTPAQTQFGGSLTPEDMWRALLLFAYPNQAAYHATDQFLIDAWEAAINMFGQIFSGITLVINTGDQLPNLQSGEFPPPSEFTQDCPTQNMDCAAETTILAYFIQPTVAIGNAKAVGEEGLNGLIHTTPVNLDVYAGRDLAQSTEQQTLPWAQILAQDQFAGAASDNPVGQGSTVAFPPDSSDTPVGCTIPPTCTTTSCVPVACIPEACLAPGVTAASLASYGTFGNVPAADLISPEQALYNTFRNYFDNTPAAASFGATVGTAPMNLLELYQNDTNYAMTNATKPPESVVETNGTIMMTTAQNLIALASQSVLSIAEDAPVINTVANAEGGTPVIAPNTWVEMNGANLGPVGFDRIWGGSDFASGKLPTSLSGVSATVNGKSAYIYYISPEQVNILTPPDAMSGPVQVQVTNGGATSASFTAQAQNLSPSFFVFNGGPYVAATHANGSLIGPAALFPGFTTPAARGETVVLYANGFGPTTNPVSAGSSQQSGTLSPLPVVKIGGATATVMFAGLVAPGEFQFNVVVPSTAASGDQSITASYGGDTTQSGTLITVGQ